MLKIWKNFFLGRNPKLVVAFVLLAVFNIAGSASYGFVVAIFVLVVWVFLVPYTIYHLDDPEHETKKSPEPPASA